MESAWLDELANAPKLTECLDGFDCALAGAIGRCSDPSIACGAAINLDAYIEESSRAWALERAFFGAGCTGNVTGCAIPRQIGCIDGKCTVVLEEPCELDAGPPPGSPVPG